MARPIGAKPWSAAELSELAAITPHAHGAIIAFAERHDRTESAVGSKLAKLRARRQAPDAPHDTAAHLASGASPVAYGERSFAARRVISAGDPPQAPVQGERDIPADALRSEGPIDRPTREPSGFDDGGFAQAMAAAIAAGHETALQGAVKEPCTVRPTFFRPHRDVARNDDLAGLGT